jgi:hypothetical protein
MGATSMTITRGPMGSSRRVPYSYERSGSEERRKTQYFEIGGNRAIYHDGWVAMTVHRIPWEFSPRAILQTGQWELYNVVEDFSEAENLAEKHKDILKELEALFLTKAVKYNVLPLDDRSVERFDPKVAGRPDLMAGRPDLMAGRMLEHHSGKSRRPGHQSNRGPSTGPSCRSSAFAFPLGSSGPFSVALAFPCPYFLDHPWLFLLD